MSPELLQPSKSVPDRLSAALFDVDSLSDLPAVAVVLWAGMASFLRTTLASSAQMSSEWADSCIVGLSSCCCCCEDSVCGMSVVERVPSVLLSSTCSLSSRLDSALTPKKGSVSSARCCCCWLSSSSDSRLGGGGGGGGGESLFSSSCCLA